MLQIHLFFSSRYFQVFDPNRGDGCLSLPESFQRLWKRRAAPSLPARQDPLHCWQGGGCLLSPREPETLQTLQTVPQITPFQLATNSLRSAAPTTRYQRPFCTSDGTHCPSLCLSSSISLTGKDQNCPCHPSCRHTISLLHLLFLIPFTVILKCPTCISITTNWVYVCTQKGLLVMSRSPFSDSAAAYVYLRVYTTLVCLYSCIYMYV